MSRTLARCAYYAIWTFALCLGWAILAGFPVRADAPPTTGTASPGKAVRTSWGFDPSNLDRSVAPCQDFYSFAVGGWLKSHPIPPAYPRWGEFEVLHEHNETILRRILERDAVAHAPLGTNRQKVGDFYVSGMDEMAIERAGLKPLRGLLARIDGARSVRQLAEAVALLHLAGVRAVFRMGATPDEKNSNLVIGELSQGGLGLPGREYYTRTDEKSVKLRQEYVAHIARTLHLAGMAPAKADGESKRILDLESQLAQASSTRVQLRDPQSNYHRMRLADAMAMVPHFGWAAYIRTLGLSTNTPINLGQPLFFKQLDRRLATVPLPVWKAYLRWHLLETMAPYLSSAFVNENFHFRGEILNGTKEILPRWKRVLRAVDGGLGEALGQEFVKVAFPPSAKRHAVLMVHSLRAALRDDLERLDWMGPHTRQQALAKLAAMRQKIGYPDRWRDYSALTIHRHGYAENIMRANRFEVRRELRRIGIPPDRNEWDMTPPTVNAYYNPNLNEIVFPAGILQPPFFDAKADDAVNYGGIGAVIGHEMTHGFDDQGSQYDARGNLRNWWSKEDLLRFQTRAKCVEDEFDGFFVEPGLHLQGKLVEGEAIADLGGLTLSWRAWKRSLLGRALPPTLDGFTPEQRFFLGFAQIWAENERAEYARLLANTNPHPLPRFRVNGTVSNMQAFWEAFGCKPGDPMERQGHEHCQIW